MARYIDAEALLKHYKALANIEWNKKVAPASWSDAYEEVVEHLEGLPTVDVVPKSEVALKIIREVERILEAKIINIEEDLFHGIALRGEVAQKNGFEEVLVELAELKKKYTESEGKYG